MASIFFGVLTMLCAYLVTIGLALALLFLTHAAAPRSMSRSGEASTLFLFLNAVIWSLSAAIGGMLVGWIGQWHPSLLACGLACALFAAILSVALKSIGRSRLDYQLAVAICASTSAVGGGLTMQIFHLHFTF